MKINKRLFLSDIDGTLLNSRGELTSKTIESIKKITSDPNNIFCLITGRNWQSTQEIYKTLNLNSLVVNCNGALIHKPLDRNFDRIHIPFCKDIIINLLQNKKFVENIDYLEVTTMLDAFKWQKPELDVMIQENVSFYEAIKGEVVFTRIKFTNKQSFDYNLRLVKKISPSIFVNAWEWEFDDVYFIEVQSEIISKAFGVKVCASYYNVDYKDIYMFGDNINDVEMLLAPGNSYALSNGVKLAKLRARNITKYSNNEEGVIKEIEEILKKYIY